MSTIVDINVTPTVETVTINTTEFLTTINVNTVTSGGINSVVAGNNITVDVTDPDNPIISTPDFVPSNYDLEDFTNTGLDPFAHVSELPTQGVQTVTGTTVDNTDPLNPIVDVPTLQQVTTAGNETTDGIGIQSLIIKGGDAYRDLVDDEMSISAFNGALDNNLVFNWLDNQISITKPIGLDTGLYNLMNTPTATPRTIAFTSIPKSANFTAENEQDYTSTATLTVTDPTPVTGKGFQVHVIAGTSTIGGVGYTAGALVYRYYDGSVWVSKNYNTPIDAVPTDGSANAVESNGVFDALALKTNETSFLAHKARTIYQSQTSITGVSVQTLLATMKIDGNVYASTDAFWFNMIVQKGVTASTVEYKIYLGTTSGALTTQIGRFIANAATRGADFNRYYTINSGNLDTTMGFTTNALSGLAQTTTVNTPVAVTMSADLWISISVTPTNSADVSGIMGASITPLK